jgi:S-formylglutathione hydrolase FrmB
LVLAIVLGVAGLRRPLWAQGTIVTVAMPNADNALGAGFYANSAATGNWEDFVARDLVRHIDRHYHTDARASKRALVGHSMGGFGAFNIGFDHRRRRSTAVGPIRGCSPSCHSTSGGIVRWWRIQQCRHGGVRACRPTAGDHDRSGN